jgi:hypothetical protein
MRPKWRPQKHKKLQEIYIAVPSMVPITEEFLRESMRMDAIYLLILAGLYLITHGLVRALQRLGKTQ